MGFWSGVFIGWATSGLGLLVFLALTSTNGDKHWQEFERDGVLYRKRLQKFDPDVSGNSAGHWDEVKL